MKEAPPPSDLPQEELTLVPDAGRDTGVMLQAMDRVQGVPPQASAQESSLESDDPIGDAIAKEIERINKIAPEVPQASSVPVALQKSAWEAMQASKGIVPPEKPTEAQKSMATQFAQRNLSDMQAEKSFSLNPFTRAGNIVSAVAEKAGDKLAKWGGQIEEAELARAEDKQLADRTVGDVVKDRMETSVRWNGPSATAPIPKKEIPISQPQTILSRPLSPEIPPPSGPIEQKARESWGMVEKELSQESWDDQESIESITFLAREIQLEEEELKIQEEELAIRRKKLLLLQKRKALEASKKKLPPPKGPATAVR